MGVFPMGQLRPYARGKASTTQFWVHLFMHIPFDAELPNLTW